MFVGDRRRLRKIGRQLLDGAIEPRQRLVVGAVGGLPFGLQRLEIVRAVRHAQRPTRPSTGLLAFAYILRGMRPDR